METDSKSHIEDLLQIKASSISIRALQFGFVCIQTFICVGLYQYNETIMKGPKVNLDSFHGIYFTKRLD